jgi:molybdate transport system substrate-binding protein
MRVRHAIVTVLAAAVVTLAAPATSTAAEITVFCSTPLRHVMAALIPEFERATNHRVLITYGASPELREKIESGAPFDLVVLTPGFLDGLIKEGKVIPGSRTPIARVGVAIAIRAGAPKPDIRTTEALKQTLLRAKSISYGIEGASGAYFAALIQKLGIADALKPKFQLKTSGEAVAQAVANGEAELGVAPATEIIPVKGAEVLGTFPAEIQDYVVLIGGVGNSARNPAPAKELLTYVTAPAADAVVRQTGMERN